MSEPLPEFDPYVTLGVGHDAPPRVVAAAYRARIRRVHPDLSDDPRSSERSKRLNVAREWLLDPGRRARYDAAHPVFAAAAARPRSASLSTPAREPSWWRSQRRIELDAFVARCGFLTRSDCSRLVASARVGRSAIEAAVGQSTALATSLGREAVVIASARLARDRVPARRWRDDPRLAEILHYSALAFATVDKAPWEASVLLRPWREAIEAADAQDRARRARLARARQAIGTVAVAMFVLLLSGLALAGLVVGVGLLVGWLR